MRRVIGVPPHRVGLLLVLAVVGACATATHDGGDAGQIPVDDAESVGVDGASLLDAPPGGEAARITSFAPASLTLPRGGMGTLTVSLDGPAGPGGVAVALASDDGGAIITLPSSIVVAQGQFSGSVLVSAVAVGGPVEVHATFGGGTETALVRVVPPLGGLTGPTSELVIGSSAVYTVSLESSTPEAIAVALSATDPTLASVAASVTIPAGASSASFNVTGTGLGRTSVVARLGTDSVSAPIRVGGVVLSEILYDLSGDDEQKEWVELYNRGSVAVNLSGTRIQINNGATGGYVDALVLAGTIAPGGCAVVGGPLAGPSAGNFTPTGFVYLVAGDFTPSLGNAGSTLSEPADAIALVTSTGAFVDVVLYGNNNDDGLVDGNGVVFAAPHVADVSPGRSIERTGPLPGTAWRSQTAPNPGACAL